MATTSNLISTPTDHELVIMRTFSAPRGLVWQVWTQQEHMVRWSCPTGFSMLFANGDLRIGGAWRAGMRSPEGAEYVMHGEYREIEEPQRLVFTHMWEEDELHPAHETLVTVLLKEKDNHTTMTFTQASLATASSRDGHAEGWSGAFNNLEALLQELCVGEFL